MPVDAVRLVGVHVAVVAMPHLVDHVGAVGIPAKVVQGVVGGIAVIVACAHAVGAWPDECFQHEGMHFVGTANSVVVQGHLGVAA